MAANQKKFTIFVRHGNDNIPFHVDEDTTVEKLKEKVGAYLNHPADEIDLVWGGKRLDGKATIKETQLENTTTVTLVLRVTQKPPPPEGCIQIFVKTPQNTTIKLDVLPSMLVKDIRKEIHDKTGIEPEFQLLFFGGKTLQNERDGKEQTLADYNLQQEGSTVHMVLRLLGGNNM